MGMIKEFKEFAVKGNMLDLAVGLIIGAAFGKVVSTFTEGIVMPPIGRLLGKVDFSSLFVNLSDKDVVSLADAKAKGAPVIAYGLFFNTILDFLIVAVVLFLVIKQFNRFKKAEAAAPPPGPTPDQVLLTEIRDLLAKR